MNRLSVWCLWKEPSCFWISSWCSLSLFGPSCWCARAARPACARACAQFWCSLSACMRQDDHEQLCRCANHFSFLVTIAFLHGCCYFHLNWDLVRFALSHDFFLNLYPTILFACFIFPILQVRLHPFLQRSEPSKVQTGQHQRLEAQLVTSVFDSRISAGTYVNLPSVHTSHTWLPVGWIAGDWWEG